MIDNEEVTDIVPADSQNTELITNNEQSAQLDSARIELNKESLELIAKIVAEDNIDRAKDLTQLFNLNQNKKTMIRVNKLSDLMDLITEQAFTRFSKRPDEISNQELIVAMKTTQDLIERSIKQTSNIQEAPLIQINQQHNEVNVGDGDVTLGRDSRERVKNAVTTLLSGIMAAQEKPDTTSVVKDTDNEILEEGENNIDDF